MLTLLEQIDKGTLWRSHGGVHPPELKNLSNKTTIGQIPLANQYVLPLPQVGDSALLAVKVNDRVLKGQVLTSGTSFAYSPVHSPTSGIITAIKAMPSNHASGIEVLSCVIQADGLDEAKAVERSDIETLSNQDILKKIQQAGIAGLGGAAFPTHIKLSPASDIELVIINGIECEPYITSDDRLMREHSDEILSGIAIIQRLLSPKRIIIAIEDNKPEAIDAMQHALNRSQLASGSTRITAVPTKYPSGGEKQLIQILTGQEVPSGAIPAQLGMLVQNVGTAYAINDAVINGYALTNRVVTVTGLNSQTPGNYWVPIGTPVKHILDSLGFSGDFASDKIIIGGPMMGHSLPDLAAPVLKGTNCILLPSKEEIADDVTEKPCIRCGECAVACPALLLPQQLFWHSKAEEYDKAASFNLHDCIECGCCSYVCPSDIPLVEYYRIAKSAIRSQTEEKKQADFAKQRFEARLQRLEEEKLAREAKAKEAAERRKGTMAASDKNAVAEAMARIKAKKAAEQASENEAAEPQLDKKAQIAAAIARAKAKKEGSASNSSESTTSVTIDDKKAQIAAAIARAKAKKSSTPAADVSVNSSQDPQGLDKKAQVATAVARAKAKKAAANTATAQPSELSVELKTDTETTVDTPVNDKQAKIAAAVARAKAKKAAANSAVAQPSELSVELKTDTETTVDTPVNDKQAKIAAAVARAKAKKAAANSAVAQPSEQSVELETNTETTEDTPVNDKQAKIAAAVARAKAKKAAAKLADETTDVVQNTNESLAEASISDNGALSGLDDKPYAPTEPVSPSQKGEVKQQEPASTMTAEQQKKARIAATIAKAKAKKAQAKLQEKE
ncbi:electron transport complex subunit RsxC [Shewanella sp. 10N.261.52.F9]|uniref:electron transport complex subunit RsxC n=1 Tax=Shewanella sp. 10N.261.52.F9 TaxID=3229684 RepID=UPI00355463D7